MTPLNSLVALTDELFALALLIDLLKAQPPNVIELLERGEGAIKQCQVLAGSLHEWASAIEAEIEAASATLQ